MQDTSINYSRDHLVLKDTTLIFTMKLYVMSNNIFNADRGFLK